MQSITPCLWFDTHAEEAATFYASVFQNGEIHAVTRYGKAASGASGMPEGTVMTVVFRIAGREFMGLNGGPHFTPSPAISFMVRCETEKELDALWERLVEGGKVLMELGEYPFNKKYGWLEDRYGISWQVMLGEGKQAITPALMFVGSHYGKAEEAITFYASVFPQSKVTFMQKREKDGAGEKAGTVAFASFNLLDQPFAAMESGLDHPFGFTPAVSLIVNCAAQHEIDRYWETLSANPKAEMCGWLEDKYGVSWQITPALIDTVMRDPDEAARERVMEKVIGMKKLELAALQRAYDGIA